jgi:tetratricopeptide (TPR) repeat protein
MQQQAPGNQPTPAQVFQEAQRQIRVGDLYAAARRAGKLRAHFPDDIPILALHGFVLAYLGVHAQALSDLVRSAQLTEEALKKDEEGNPARPRIIDQLIRLSVQICRSSIAIGEEAAATEAIENALQWDPDRADAVAAKAELLAYQGHVEDALGLIEQGFKDKLETMPLVLAKARILLGDESTYEDQLKAIVPLLEEEAAVAGLPAIELGDLLRSLGHVHDRLENFDDSFNAFRRAARLRRGKYDPRTYTMMTTKVIADWSLENLSKVIKPEPTGSSHAFILGSPHSGVEQLGELLGQLDGFTNVGPLETMAATCIQQLGAKQGVLRPVPFEPQKIRRNQLEDAGKSYVMQVRAIAGDPFSTCVDTHPLNIPHAGAAAMMMPGVNIVVCRRDPTESALACYCDAMPGNHPYAGDLLNVAGFVADSNRMLDHWTEILGAEAIGANIIEVQYDELRNDPAGTAARVATQMGHDAVASAITQLPAFLSGPATHADDFNNYTKQIRDLLEPASAES